MMRIVIVEDEIRIREGMIRLISKINQEHVIVGEADNGREGMRQIEAVMPDLIITDIKMPDMDGL
jgi:two-component system response regulator YesN